jgi:hypothetical protein
MRFLILPPLEGDSSLGKDSKMAAVVLRVSILLLAVDRLSFKLFGSLRVDYRAIVKAGVYWSEIGSISTTLLLKL